MAISAMAITTWACDKDTTEPIINEEFQSEPQYVYDLPSDTGNTQTYTLWSLENKVEVSLLDSNSEKWQVAFKGTTIRFNSGVSGPGEVKAFLTDAIYDEVLNVPEGEFKEDEAEQLAIPEGAQSGWYNYNFEQHVITPIPGKVLVLQNGNQYYKLEILSYYKGAPASPNAETHLSRYYTFRYQTIQL